jgi:nucleoside-diphosphate-sugar epimerase
MILLTGCSGFIGKHLLNALINNFGKSHLLCLTSKPITDSAYLLHQNYQFSPNYFVQNGYNNIETIIHAGAFTPKNGAEANSITLSNTNINNTFNLLSAQFPALKQVIFLSTLDVYDHAEIISEVSPEKPVSLYGYSKLYGEKMLEQWGIQNKIKTQILRIGHVYGPGEEAYQKIIPVTIKKVLTQQPVELWGAGEELRSFIYINDVVNAIINTLALNEQVGVINIVGGKAITVANLVEKICKLSDYKVEVTKIKTDKPGRNLTFDNSKMKKYLLANETELEVGLKEEFNYMKNLLF